MKTKQIIAQAKKQIKRMVAPNQIESFKVFEMLGSFTAEVVMQSTCEANKTMTWNFDIDYTPSNEDIFTEVEKAQFPNLITKESVTVTLIK